MDTNLSELAQEHWLQSTNTVRVLPAVIQQIWSQLVQDDFAQGSLSLLESLQTVEKYLWPGYSDNATDAHILILAFLINVKRRDHLPCWSLFVDRPRDFSSFFRRLLSLSLDSSQPFPVRNQLLVTLIGAFQSLDNGLVRKECAPLVSISIWHNLHSESSRVARLEKYPPFKKIWRNSEKRFDAADELTRSKLLFDRSWLFALVSDFLEILWDPNPRTVATIAYCERFIELLTDLQSQFPTRRYVNTLLQDLNLLTAIQSSPAYRQGDGGIHDLHALLRHFTSFPLDDRTGLQYTPAEASDELFGRLARLQRVALKHFNDDLSLLALSNYGALTQRVELETHLQPLSDQKLIQLCKLLDYRTEYSAQSKIDVDRKFLVELLLAAHEKCPSYQDTIRNMALLPTETLLYDPSLLRNESYTGARPLAIPKLNLQYLSAGDFLWRSFILYRCESFYEIRKDLEETVQRLQLRLSGSSKMALHITKPAIIDVAVPKVGDIAPAYVRAEILLDVSRLHDTVRKEWESLRPDDVVFLLAVQPREADQSGTSDPDLGSQSNILQTVRAAQIVQVQDERGRPLRMHLNQTNGYHARPRQRRLLVNLDPMAYHKDITGAQSKSGTYESINLIVRRRSRENNFKYVLETIKDLVLADTPTTLPSWLQDVFLGLGDPASASYTQLSNAMKKLDYRDTFVDQQHLLDSFPGKTLKAQDGKANLPRKPPFVLEADLAATNSEDLSKRSSKKRRRDEPDGPEQQNGVVKVSTYKPPQNGPYPEDTPKLNTVRYTPKQVEAITAGTQPGLTIIVGPPGTGKTDVATQIINNIYHNFPHERTLLIAHSNQALNQLFQKITALDIDQRHLLRLGHGEGDLQLQSEGSYSKHGRVDSLLEHGGRLLAEVNRLAASIRAPGAHGNSCETAEYFDSVYVQPTWLRFESEVLNKENATVAEIESGFPFHAYFANAPQPLFAEGGSSGDAKEVAHGCYRHIRKIFSELADIRPFEVLRNDRSKSNYLLTHEARIIAMTSTHAAMRRHEIAELGFRYDNVIMEEAAQITEIENFIPLAMQKKQDKDHGLKRVVLCGDHLQNSPIVQNLAFRQYANLEQSLFLRLVRLGVPTIVLDQQGRARPSLAELYKWRYPSLGNLPSTLTAPEFVTANAGFRYDYQFIDVSDYKGRGETEPAPHFIQNLGEAEFAVAIFMYMRLLGYAASTISILTTYAGQRALIKDVLNHRCAKNRLFGLPKTVNTVDKYQGEQNDYIILSLVRTNRPGYLRDIRRLTVALSRARLGLYVLGRRQTFENCAELQEAFHLLWQQPNKLMLVTGEMFPTQRAITADAEATPMEGVEHLGQYVFEMTQAKVADLKGGVASLPPVEPAVIASDEDEDDAEQDVEGTGDGQNGGSDEMAEEQDDDDLE